MKVHILKVWSEWFGDIKSGKKQFELRKNDRDFKIGDELILAEWKNLGYTGRYVRVLVTCVMQAFEALTPGYVCMGIRLKCTVNSIGKHSYLFKLLKEEENNTENIILMKASEVTAILDTFSWDKSKYEEHDCYEALRHAQNAAIQYEKITKLTNK